MRGTRTVGRHRAALHGARPGRRGGLRQLQGRRFDSRTRGRCSRPARSHGPTPSTTTSASRSTRFPIRSTRPTCAPTTRCSTRRRAGTSSTSSQHQGRRTAIGARALSAAPDGRHRLSGFRRPYFFNATSLPHSNLDRVSARYEAQAVTPWLANLSLTAYYQRTERLLRNALPVQFPAPTPARSSRSA